MSVGLIVNPKSGKNSGSGLKLAEMLTGKPQVHVEIIEDFASLPQIMARMAEAQVDTLFISSGDGTVQAIQTDIAERGLFERQPRLSLLPHGTTNMTAADLGFSERDLPAQALFIAASGLRDVAVDVRVRPTVRVVNPRDGQTRHGMFLGTGAVWQGTRFCQRDVHATGLKGDWATFATLATALFKAAFWPANRQDESRIDRAYSIAVASNGQSFATGDQLLYLATTLEKLILGTRPFWGGATGPLRSTIVGYPPPNVFRWALPLMRGGEDRKLPQGCVSFCKMRVEVETDCPFVIDGEFFEPPKGEPLVIETGPDFSYVCG